MKERLRKIYELSLHGTDGEKANAQELLKNLLSKHRLSIADIADEAKAERRFKPKNKTEVRLLCQIVNKVTDGDNRAIWSYRGSKDRVVELTTAEFIEVEAQPRLPTRLILRLLTANDWRPNKMTNYYLGIAQNRVNPAKYNGWDGALQGCINDVIGLGEVCRNYQLIFF